MKISIIAAMALLMTIATFAQETKPHYLPGDGVYLVGMPGSLKNKVTEPTVITQAYKAKFNVSNTDLAAIKAGGKSYNIVDYINDEGTELNLVRFMGIGEAYNLVVRDMEGGSYQLGDYAPEKTWTSMRMLAAYPKWQGESSYPLCVYDQWDCPITYEADPMLGVGKNDAVTVNFGNPHEGLVVSNVNFPLVVGKSNDITKLLKVTLTVWDEKHEKVTDTYTMNLRMAGLTKVSSTDTYNICDVELKLPNSKLVINTPFDVTVSGFAQSGVKAWLPRAVDTHALYPTHTTYTDATGAASKDEAVDACVNVEGYFNYLGTWGWWDGKYERGEVVPASDFVQVYYDPSDPDWPGEYFMGEAAFPVECTFGVNDIIVAETPSWMTDIATDDSQWAEYGCVQLAVHADALPSDVTGRSGKVVFSTSDGASLYTIYVRQGAAWFDYGTDDAINAPTITLPAEGGFFDLSGRRIGNGVQKGMYIKGGKKFIIK